MMSVFSRKSPCPRAQVLSLHDCPPHGVEHEIPHTIPPFSRLPLLFVHGCDQRLRFMCSPVPHADVLTFLRLIFHEPNVVDLRPFTEISVLSAAARDPVWLSASPMRYESNLNYLTVSALRDSAQRIGCKCSEARLNANSVFAILRHFEVLRTELASSSVPMLPLHSNS
ncbi:hypothetical protein F4604DRAFT_265563 [Suillus subluteus]|nr:hypothetical protein F4604DRAFT_265563 [Suillus subluteus]